VKPGEDEVRFVISLDDLAASLATIKLQVIDAVTQAPLPGASAMMWGGTYMDGGKYSDSSGNIVIEDREPGEFDLHVSAKGHEEYKAHILADAGVTTDLGQIALDTAIEVEAMVVDGTGAPISTDFSIGTFEPATRALSMERQMGYKSKGDGSLALFGLGRRVYLLGTDGTKWVSGDVLLDLRSGVAPANFVIKLVPATRLVLIVKGEPADHLRFRVTDEQALDLVNGSFYGSGPRPLTLPPGTYKVALLDANKAVLSEKSVTLGSTPMSLELAR
jgi:hypothetical protein